MSCRFLILATCLVGCNLIAPSVHSEPIKLASLFQLVDDPTSYDDKRVGVTGYVGDPFREYLFLSNDHSKIGDISSAVLVRWPSDAPDECFNRFVRVEGKFGRKNGGEFSITSLERISALDETSGLITTCWSS